MRINRIVGLLFGLLSAVGCDENGGSGASEREPASPGPLSVNLKDGTELKGSPASITVRFAEIDSPAVEISIVAEGVSTKWGALILSGKDFLSSGTIDAHITAGEVRDGEAAVQRSKLNGDDVVFASQGTLTLAVENGVLEGSADGISSQFSGNFQGPVDIACYVPSDAIESDVEAPSVMGGSAPVLVLDVTLKSPQCRGLNSSPLTRLKDY